MPWTPWWKTGLCRSPGRPLLRTAASCSCRQAPRLTSTSRLPPSGASPPPVASLRSFPPPMHTVTTIIATTVHVVIISSQLDSGASAAGLNGRCLIVLKSYGISCTALCYQTAGLFTGSTSQFSTSHLAGCVQVDWGCVGIHAAVAEGAAQLASFWQPESHRGKAGGFWCPR